MDITSLTAGLDSGNAFKALYHSGEDFRIKVNYHNNTFEVYLPFLFSDWKMNLLDFLTNGR